MHTIRLRRPWLRSVDGGSVADKVDVPDDAPIDAARVTYRRTFNRPTGLTTEDRVWLSIRRFTARSARVVLNERPIHQTRSHEPIRLEITTNLLAGNRLQIHLDADDDRPPALDGAVSLEIESHESLEPQSLGH